MTANPSDLFRGQVISSTFGLFETYLKTPLGCDVAGSSDVEIMASCEFCPSIFVQPRSCREPQNLCLNFSRMQFICNCVCSTDVSSFQSMKLARAQLVSSTWRSKAFIHPACSSYKRLTANMPQAGSKHMRAYASNTSIEFLYDQWIFLQKKKHASDNVWSCVTVALWARE